MAEKLLNLWNSTGFTQGTWQNYVMLAIACALFFLAIVKQFEPLLLLPIAFGMFCINIPGGQEVLMPIAQAKTEISAAINSNLADGEALKNLVTAESFINAMNGAGDALTYVLSKDLSLDALAAAASGVGVDMLGNAGTEIAYYLSANADGVNIYNSAMQTIATMQGVTASDVAALEGVGVPLVTQVQQTFVTDCVEILRRTEGLSEGLFDYFYFGVEHVIFPPIIFLGIGAMTDFGPLIANPKSLILGAAAQTGIFITLVGAILLGFDGAAAASIAIIGGADGPTAIYLTSKLGQTDLLPIIAIAAYSYMALIPLIQPPIMRLLTTKKERSVRMQTLRPVSKKEKVIFPIVVTLLVAIILPSALPLIGMLMLGNLLKESLVTDRLAKTASNELINIVTIFLGIVVGAKSYGPTFLALDTLKIILLGLIAFCFGTIGGLLVGKLMYVLSKGKVNPLIGAAGVSAVPMAARVAQKVGQEEDKHNYLLMHAMGPNVAGVIGSAVAAGFLLAWFG